MGYWGESGTRATWSNPQPTPEGSRQSGGWYYNPSSGSVDRWWTGSPPSSSGGSTGGGGGGIGDALRQANERAKEREAQLRREQEERDREVERQRVEREKLFSEFTGAEQGLQSKLETAISGFESPEAIRARLGTELGVDLGELKSQSDLLRETLEAIPGNVGRIAAQFPLTGGARDRRIQAQVAEVAPSATRAQESLQEGVGLISNLTSAELSEQRFNKLTPIQQEFDTLKDRIARETSGFDKDSQNRLDALMSKLAVSGSLLDNELTLANELAVAEDSYMRQQWQIENNSRQIIDKDGRQVLINPYTGEVLQDMGASSGGGGGESDVWVTPPPDGTEDGATSRDVAAVHPDWQTGGGRTEAELAADAAARAGWRESMLAGEKDDPYDVIDFSALNTAPTPGTPGYVSEADRRKALIHGVQGDVVL